jgi:hypothetical protein
MLPLQQQPLLQRLTPQLLHLLLLFVVAASHRHALQESPGQARLLLTAPVPAASAQVQRLLRQAHHQE